MEAINTTLQLVVLGFTVEAVVETLKLLYVAGKVSIPAILALVAGIILALTVNFDLLVIIGFDPVIPYVGIVLAGVLISRGGNFVHQYLATKDGVSKDE